MTRTKLQQKFIPNKEANTETDVVYFQLAMEISTTHVEKDRIVERNVDTLTVKGWARKDAPDVDEVIVQGAGGSVNIKNHLEALGVIDKIKEAAKIFSDSLFDGIPGTVNPQIKYVVCDLTKPIFSNLLNEK